jgi:hypothetical protein
MSSIEGGPAYKQSGRTLDNELAYGAQREEKHTYSMPETLDPGQDLMPGNSGTNPVSNQHL